MSDPKPPTEPTPAEPRGLASIDVNEYGGRKDGVRQEMNRRLFMQLLVFDVPPGGDADTSARQVGIALRERGIAGVVYADVMDPRGVGLLTWSEDPSVFATRVRNLFNESFEPMNMLRHVTIRRDFGMLGRSYSTGHEPDLADALLKRPVRNVLNESLPWHVWYPLKRNGAFAKLEPHDQSMILREHAALGMAYGAQELAHDIRLACHGLDSADNDFIIGLVGSTLQPLSHLVQAMRKTRQTSEFIAKMGPFFVGHVITRSEGE